MSTGCKPGLSSDDIVVDLELPDETVVAAILTHSLTELAGICVGWDRRRVRKLVLTALAQRRGTPAR